MIIPACTKPPHYWVENVSNHTARCIKLGCGAVKDLEPAVKEFLKQPQGKSTPSEMSDPYFVERKTRKSRKKATAY